MRGVMSWWRSIHQYITRTEAWEYPGESAVRILLRLVSYDST